MGKKVLTDDEFFKGKDFIDWAGDEMKKKGLEIKELDLGRIKEKENVRKKYESIQELADSITQKGLLQPITVTSAENDCYEIVFGHRRYQAYCYLNETQPGKYTRIKAIVKEKGSFDPEELKEVQLIENIQREDLTPLETKEALEYFRSTGLSNKEIAQKLGKAEGFVHNMFSSIKTINANPELAELLKTNAGVSFTDIQDVKPLPYKQQIELISLKAKGDIKTRNELREKVWEVKNALYESGKTFRDKKSHYEILKVKPSGELRIKSFSYNPKKTSIEDRDKLLTLLKDLVNRIEGGAQC